MQMYKISEEALKGILAYLAQRPYQEVVQGIQALSNLEKIETLSQESNSVPQQKRYNSAMENIRLNINSYVSDDIGDVLDSQSYIITDDYNDGF